MILNFTKMNGAGNDFVVLDNRDGSRSLTSEQIAMLCDRHRGVGADGLLAVEAAEGEADFRMRYYNADGGEAEMCGNGARCFGRYLKTLEGCPENDTLTFETIAGLISASFPNGPDGLVEINLSEPFDLTMGLNLDVAGEQTAVHSVNTGVPHACIITKELSTIDIVKVGAALRYHEQFSPAGTNANVIEVKTPDHIAIRTYERGVEGETLACGTGMVACAIVHHELTGTLPPISVDVAGGDSLQVNWAKSDDSYSDVTLTGPADIVFTGTVTL